MVGPTYNIRPRYMHHEHPLYSEFVYTGVLKLLSHLQYKLDCELVNDINDPLLWITSLVLHRSLSCTYFRHPLRIQVINRSVMT